MIQTFAVSRLPEIHFGVGSFDNLPQLVSQHGKRVLLVTGGQSFADSPFRDQLCAGLQNKHCSWLEWRVVSEPSPQLVDEAVCNYRKESIDVVLAIGGGSVLDAAKAVAGLLPSGQSVMDFLEGVGPELPYVGPSLPYIAVPTTAGTGSEATKNAVLSVQGNDGYKKSFRHDQLVPRQAVVDPRLLASCPPELIAANGMDALTQLLESYVSLRANPFTDALALSGLEAVRDGLLEWYGRGQGAVEAQTRMAYAALLSGITLAQVGLGSVHGLASPLGAFFPIPHGVACGSLVACATARNIEALRARLPGGPALEKYARVGRLLTRKETLASAAAWRALVDLLEQWTEQMALPRLGVYGVRPESIPNVVAHSRGSSMKTNPITLTDEEIGTILAVRI